jgi:hypothetical protein
MKDGRDPKGWDFGWFPDPDRPGEERFWNGSSWTQRRQASTDPDADRDSDTGSQKTLWLVAGGVVILAILGTVLLAMLLDQSASVVEDDDAEFREVSVTECEPPGALTTQQVRGVANNGSSERSDYHIEVAVFSPDGTRVGTGSTDVRDVEPGQRAVWTSETDTAEQDWVSGSTCQVLSVERTASF